MSRKSKSPFDLANATNQEIDQASTNSLALSIRASKHTVSTHKGRPTVVARAKEIRDLLRKIEVPTEQELVTMSARNLRKNIREMGYMPEGTRKADLAHQLHAVLSGNAEAEGYKPAGSPVRDIPVDKITQAAKQLVGPEVMGNGRLYLEIEKIGSAAKDLIASSISTAKHYAQASREAAKESHQALKEGGYRKASEIATQAAEYNDAAERAAKAAVKLQHCLDELSTC